MLQSEKMGISAYDIIGTPVNSQCYKFIIIGIFLYGINFRFNFYRINERGNLGSDLDICHFFCVTDPALSATLPKSRANFI